MKRSLFIWQFAGLTFTVILGTLFHFLFEWTDILFFAPFSAVNESTWEHMKILFFPMLIFALIQSKFFIKEYPAFWQIKFWGIFIGTLSIPFLFYTYNGVFGNSPAWVNVLIFFLSAGIAYLSEFYFFKKETDGFLTPLIAKILLALIAIIFILFTFFPLEIPLLQDPISLLYGIV